MALLAWLSHGSLGLGRLTDIGPNPWHVFLWTGAEITAGGVIGYVLGPWLEREGYRKNPWNGSLEDTTEDVPDPDVQEQHGGDAEGSARAAKKAAKAETKQAKKAEARDKRAAKKSAKRKAARLAPWDAQGSTAMTAQEPGDADSAGVDDSDGHGVAVPEGDSVGSEDSVGADDSDGADAGEDSAGPVSSSDPER